jgi:acyl carrier protein
MLQPSTSIARPAKPVSTDQLRKLIASIDTGLNLNKLKDTTRFVDAEADSLDFFNLVIALEEAYKITIPDSDLGKVDTLDRLAKYLNERLP